MAKSKTESEVVTEAKEHSPWFEKIKGYYPAFWNIEMVRNAVKKGKITAEEFEEITGEKYEQ
jgi:hypothetical protein